MASEAASVLEPRTWNEYIRGLKETGAWEREPENVDEAWELSTAYLEAKDRDQLDEEVHPALQVRLARVLRFPCGDLIPEGQLRHCAEPLPAVDPTREPSWVHEPCACESCGEGSSDFRCQSCGGRVSRASTIKRIRDVSRRIDARREREEAQKNGDLEPALSDFDRQVLELRKAGFSFRDICGEMKAAYGTVQRSIGRIRKAGIKAA